MSDTSGNTTPTSYWVVSGLLAIWSLMGVSFYILFAGTSADEYAAYVADGTMTQAYADYAANTPAWATAVFAIAVFSGLAGAICLLLRKKWAVQLFTISLVFVLISMFKGFILDGAANILSPFEIGREFVVVALAAFAVWFSRKKRAAGILT